MIEIKELSKSFGELKAVDSLSISVPKGELFCFLGPNGAGKTTTIKMLTGLMKSDSGCIKIDQHDIKDYPVEAKRIMGYIPDTPYIYEHLTPVEYIEFVADLYKVSAERVAETLNGEFKELGLEQYKDTLVRDLSHGFRQRLIYVATFLHEPQVIFVDEPLVGLDPYTIRVIKDLLRARVKAGMTIFLTTHILAVAEEIADRIGIISNGRLVALGTLAELRKEVGADDSLEDIFLQLTAEG
ncbi:MAG: ABC transporter ATP-binding protein [Kiritimatiellae bacterium]|nr:ABC transporter ATP-binding protein [Kiritimatiellia bacterium]